jgi:hypothetical protein
MNTAEIDCVLRRTLHGKKVRFVGVFPANEVPKCGSGFPFCFVANTAPSNDPGEHWVSFWVDSGRTEFFDSAGMPNDVYPDLDIPYDVTSYNATQLQPGTSNTCGHFCIYFMCARAFGFSLPSIVRTLSGLQPEHRDSLVTTHLATVVDHLSLARPCVDACLGQQCCKSYYKVRRCSLLQ